MQTPSNTTTSTGLRPVVDDKATDCINSDNESNPSDTAEEEATQFPHGENCTPIEKECFSHLSEPAGHDHQLKKTPSSDNGGITGRSEEIITEEGDASNVTDLTEEKLGEGDNPTKETTSVTESADASMGTNEETIVEGSHTSNDAGMAETKQERENPPNKITSVAESEKNTRKTNDPVEDNNKATEISQSVVGDQGNQLPPPSLPIVTCDQLINYPKKSLRAQSYFDIQQVRIVKPITLLSMGISVPNFPDFENDRVIKYAIKRTKHQLYLPTDVLLTAKNSRVYLRKEVMRRAILLNLEGMDEDSIHGIQDRTRDNSNPDGIILHGSPGEFDKKIRLKLPQALSFSSSQCINWLRDTPLPAEEHSHVLACAGQWRQLVKNQISMMVPRTRDMRIALAESESSEGEKGEEVEEEEEPLPVPAGAGVTSSASANTMSNQIETYTNHLLANSVVNGFNAQEGIPHHQGKLTKPMNMINIQAQLINQYKLQLASLQTQIATASRETQFEIYVSKDTFKFNASHFVAYPGFRERLHGHNYRASVKLIGSHQIGRDGYVLDFGCVKSAAKDVCKQLNEYFLVPTLSDVLKIVVGEDVDEDSGKDGQSICGECEPERKKKRRRKGEKYPGSVTITCEDGSTFVFPKQDCILLPIMHSTAEELAIYIYGKILGRLDAQFLLKRGVKTMEVTVSEAVGQDAVFRHAIPSSGSSNFDVASYISSEPLLVAPCATDTEAAKMMQSKS